MATFARADYLDRQTDGRCRSRRGTAPPTIRTWTLPRSTQPSASCSAPLDERQREIVWKRIVEGRPSAEVAAMLGTTPGNIDVIVHRALAKMREAAT